MFPDPRTNPCRIPHGSQTPFYPPPGAGNIAKYDLPHSRRRTRNCSGPVPVFFGIMTSGLWGVREKRYNRAFYGLRCTWFPWEENRLLPGCEKGIIPGAGEESLRLFHGISCPGIRWPGPPAHGTGCRQDRRAGKIPGARTRSDLLPEIPRCEKRPEPAFTGPVL